MRNLLAQRRFAALICAAALLLKLLVPTGFMVSDVRGTITVSICSGTASRTTTVAMPGMAAMSDDGRSQDHGKVEMPCAFSGLSASALGAVDPVMLVAALAIVAAAALSTAARPVLRPAPYLRPPLRGPPLSLN